MSYGKILSREWYGATLSALAPKNADFFPSDGAQIFMIKDFLSKEKCEEVIDAFKNRVLPATTTTSRENFRTSETYEAVANSEDGALIAGIEDKISEAMNLCYSHSEALLFEKFSEGQFFKPHHDWFTPDSWEYEEHAKPYGQRTWSFIIELNDVKKGGQINFPKLEEFKPQKPTQGTAIGWNNLDKEGTENPLAQHETKPVGKGEKYILTKMWRMKSFID